MLKTPLVYISEILLQSFICVVLYICIYNIFSNIDRKIRPLSINSADIIREMRIGAVIILLTALVLLSLTIIINILYKPLPGFYLVSLFLLYLGKNAIFPSKGRKIIENCWVAPFLRDDFIVTLNDRSILIRGENLDRDRPDQVIFKETSPKWLPPHQNEIVSEKDYEYVLNAVLKFLEKSKKQGVIKNPRILGILDAVPSSFKNNKLEK